MGNGCHWEPFSRDSRGGRQSLRRLRMNQEPCGPGDRVFVGRGAAPPVLQMGCLGARGTGGHRLTQGCLSQPWKRGRTGEDSGSGTLRHRGRLQPPSPGQLRDSLVHTAGVSSCPKSHWRDVTGVVSSGASIPSPFLSTSPCSSSRELLIQSIRSYSVSSWSHPLMSAGPASPKAGPGQLRVPKNATTQPCARSSRGCTGTTGDHGAGLGTSPPLSSLWHQSRKPMCDVKATHLRLRKDSVVHLRRKLCISSSSDCRI